jgi:hypothetical protein
MKTQKTIIRSSFLVLAGLCAFLYAGANQALAHDDHDGFWDDHHHYHHYEYYHHHRGYWDDRSGVRVWIGI